MLTPSLPSEAATGVPVSAWRRLDAGLFARAANGTPRTGILPWTVDDLVTGTSDLAMTYRIGPFVAVTARGTGVERIANDASETRGTDPAPQANSRIDVIWVRAAFVLDGDTTPSVDFGVTKGAANANPQKPTIPAGALELATAVVTSSDLATQTCVITQTARFTAAAGGTVLLRSQAEMDAWVPVEGSRAWRIDTDRGYQFHGPDIGWVQDTGKPTTAAITPNAAGGVSAGSVPPRVLEQGGRVYPEGILQATSSSWTAGTEYGVGVANAIPAAYAPKVEKRFPILSNDIFFGQLIFKTDGGINWRPAQSYTAGLILPLDGPSWPLKKLV